MANKTSKYLPAAVVVIIIAAAAGMQYYKNRKPGSEQKPSGQKNQSQKSGSQAGQISKPGKLEGTLKVSDDLKRGNLMLETAERKIYMFTSRDYSALLDKQVSAEIDGTLENFRLLDIVAK